jgi:DNA-directed RNA polymerase subunit RPC12/RpoP
MHNSIGSCEHCGHTFQYRLVHNGFSDSAYAYCDKCSFTVLLSGWSEAAKRVRFRVQLRITPDVESLLKPCPCGGVFRAAPDPKCPHCSQSLSATKAADYIERNAPGTAKGWRWDLSWSGVYSIVLNENIVEDWWNDNALDRLSPGLHQRPR